MTKKKRKNNQDRRGISGRRECFFCVIGKCKTNPPGRKTAGQKRVRVEERKCFVNPPGREAAGQEARPRGFCRRDSVWLGSKKVERKTYEEGTDLGGSY